MGLAALYPAGQEWIPVCRTGCAGLMTLSVHSPFYDVVILGGGPAGAAAGIELNKLDRTLRVLLVEAEMLAGWHVGETLAPRARQLLEGLGCWDEAARDGVLESVETIACSGGSRPPA